MAESAAAVAVFFSGQLRTFRRCAALAKRNLIDCNPGPVVFALVEGTDTVETVTALLVEYFGADVRIGAVLAQPSFRTPEYEHHTTVVLPTRPAMRKEVFEQARVYPAYIYNGGTLLQYYHLVLLWNALCAYEAAHGMTFAAVVRARWDGLLTVPLHVARLFSGVNASASRCMGSPHLERSLPHLADGKGLWWDDELPTRHHAGTVWTFGSEQMWVAPRATFAILVRIYDEYGSQHGEVINAAYAVPMDSESIFHAHCRKYGIAHWNFQEAGNPRFNDTHAGSTGPVLVDPYMFTLLRQ